MKKIKRKKKRKIKKPKLRIPVAPPEIIHRDDTAYDRKRKKKEYHIEYDDLPQGTVVTFKFAPNWIM